MFKCEQGGVHEHPPCYDTQDDKAIARWRLVEVENFSRIKELHGIMKEKFEVVVHERTKHTNLYC